MDVFSIVANFVQKNSVNLLKVGGLALTIGGSVLTGKATDMVQRKEIDKAVAKYQKK